MRSIEIRKCLLERQLSMADIARSIGQKRESVSAVVHGRRKTPHIRRAIAESIGKTYREVWGADDPGVDRLPVGRPSKSVDNGTHNDRLPQDSIGDKANLGGIN